MGYTFKLSELNQDFGDKVIFIQIIHSSGLGGPELNKESVCGSKRARLKREGDSK